MMEVPKHATASVTEEPGSSISEKNGQPQVPTAHHADSNLPTASWPSEPIDLVPDTTSSVLMAIFDTSLVVIPLLLIAKTGLVIGAWKRDRYHSGSDIDLVSGLTTFLIEFNGQMVTAFTIVFVTVMSTLVRRYALWKAQRGAYVSELEQLQGSISLPSTFKMIISLRAFTLTSVALVCVWSFYYLGSQASKREFLKVSSNNFHKMQVYTAGPDVLSGFSPAAAAVDQYSNFDAADVNKQFVFVEQFESYKTSDALTGTDFQGSSMIPDLKAIRQSQFPGDILQPNRHGWVDVSKQSQVKYYYSSLLGRPIYTMMPTSGESATAITVNDIVGDYELHTSYFDIGCSIPTILPFESFPNGTYLNQSMSLNMTQTRADAPRDKDGHALREFDLWLRWEPYFDDMTGTFLPANSSRQVCNVSSVYVDLKVHCQDLGCYPRQMRYANHASQYNATSYSTAFDSDAFSSNFFTNLLLSYGPQLNISKPTGASLSLSSNLQWSLSSSPHYIQEYYSAEPSTATSFNQFISRYMNTYYIISQAQNGVSPLEGVDGYVQVPMHGAYYDPHYAVFWPWIAVDFVSCFILLIAAIAACWLRMQTLAPDIFGYVSSLTRDNQYLGVPDSGTTLCGMERARLLNKVKVKIGDVSNPEEPTGRIGLAQVGSNAPVRVENLRSTTAYV
jgi:hypothetical protein